MADWATLCDAYGSAEEIPTQIQAWIEDPSAERLDDLWGRLCHQGTVYSASFEAIALLAQACPHLSTEDRHSALMLAGAIWASDDRCEGAAPGEAITQWIPRLMQMIESCMGDTNVGAVEFPYLLQAAASFHGDLFCGRQLGRLAEGEFPSACPGCDSQLFIAIGQYGYFTCMHDDFEDVNAKRTEIVPALSHAMPPIGAWLYEQATRCHQDVTAKGVTHIFGTTTCPTCNAVIAVLDAIARGTEP